MFYVSDRQERMCERNTRLRAEITDGYFTREKGGFDISGFGSLDRAVSTKIQEKL
jgi:hypothetical protein